MIAAIFAVAGAIAVASTWWAIVRLVDLTTISAPRRARLILLAKQQGAFERQMESGVSSPADRRVAAEILGDIRKELALLDEDT